MEKSQQETQSQDFKFKEADEAPDEELRFKGIYFNPLQQASNLRRQPAAVQKKKDTHSSAWRDKMKREIDKKQHSEQQERAQLKQQHDTDEQNYNTSSNHTNEYTSSSSVNGTNPADNLDKNHVNNINNNYIKDPNGSNNNTNKLSVLKDNSPFNEANTAVTQLTKSPTEIMNNNKTCLRQAITNSDNKLQQKFEQNEQEEDNNNNPANNLAVLAKKSTSLNNLNNEPLSSQQQQISNRGRCSQMKIGGTCMQQRNNRKRRRQQSKGLTQQLNSGLPQKSLKLFQASNSKSSGSSENEDDLDDDLEEEQQRQHSNFFQNNNNNINNLLENINANHMNNNNNFESQSVKQQNAASSIRLAQQQQNGQRNNNHLFFDRLDRKSSGSSSNSEIEECFPQNKPIINNTNNNPGKSNGFNKWSNIFDKNNNNSINSSIDKSSLQKGQSSNDSLEELQDTQPNQILRSQAQPIPTTINNIGAQKNLGQNGTNSAVTGMAGSKTDQYFLRTKLVKQLDSEDSEITVKIEQVNIKPFQTFIAEIIAINHLSQDINDSDVTLAVKQYVQGLVKQTYHIQHSLQVGKMYSFKFKTLLKNDHFPILNVDEYTLVQ